MKKAKTLFIICLLFFSMLIVILPAAKASNQDSFGYTYTDSNTLGGPVFNWVEISTIGNQVSQGDLLGATTNNVDLGFDFSYYGKSYSSVGIDLEGLLLFEPVDNRGWYDWSSLPIGNSPNIHGFVAPFWDSLFFTMGSSGQYLGGAVYYLTLGEEPNRQFIVEWQDLTPNYVGNVNCTYSTKGITFEAILNENSNNIQFQYKNLEVQDWSGTVLQANGESATVGIENQLGNGGLQYSYHEPAISQGLAIQFSFPTGITQPDMYVSINAPFSQTAGESIEYSISYSNLGGSTASDVVLHANLSSGMHLVNFISASDNGIYDPVTGIVTWVIGSVSPIDGGTRTVIVGIPENTLDGTDIVTSANVATSTPELSYDNNFGSVETLTRSFALPANVQVNGGTGDPSGEMSVYYGIPTSFQYQDSAATGIDIVLHFDGQPDILGSMTGPAPTWTYTVTFLSLDPPRHGEAQVEYITHYPQKSDQTVSFSIYVDPAGYIYDTSTLERVSGATVCLQMPNGLGGWMNIPTGNDPPVMQPDMNPQITGVDGQFQWDTLPGTYRVHVEAPGYYPADSIAVTIPPPITDLHVGLVPITDNPPPVTTLYIDNKKQTDSSGPTQVTSSTQLILTAQDNYGGSGVASTNYQISNSKYSSGWIKSTPPTSFQLSGLADGTYTIEYFSTDFSGNVEPTKTTNVILASESTLTFTETGLPAGTSWSVTFDGITQSTTTDVVTFIHVSIGINTWTASDQILEGIGTRYVASTSSGTINVPVQTSQRITFTPQYQVSLTLTPTGTGTVNPKTTNYYDSGSQVSISANTKSGYAFWQWTASNPSIIFATSSDASTTATINGPGTITATFATLVSGNKNIAITGSNNVVVVAGGNNIIDCSQATSTTIIQTGAGNNQIKFGGGDNVFKSTVSGNDIITAGNGNNNINIVGNGNNQITTGSGNDQIQITGNGNNIINAGSGDNTVTVSGTGNNQVTTGSGNDIITVGTGNNIIKAGDGTNKVTAGNGNNQITTGSGSDTVIAGKGNNNIQTGAGDDTITVGNGNNVIDGGAGYDTCIHGTGNNTILNCEKK
jgi:Domain of unknown function DUF11/Divergent InlB B-repeat domain/RTX calcium-binding nonapeptide repeat (4 copies)